MTPTLAFRRADGLHARLRPHVFDEQTRTVSSVETSPFTQDVLNTPSSPFAVCKKKDTQPPKMGLSEKNRTLCRDKLDVFNHQGTIIPYLSVAALLF